MHSLHGSFEVFICSTEDRGVCVDGVCFELERINVVYYKFQIHAAAPAVLNTDVVIHHN